MSRPTTHDDLPIWQREGHTVATISADQAVKYPTLGMHLLAALVEAAHLGLTIDAGMISVPKSEAELDAVLKSAQVGWDALNAYYVTAQGGGTVAESVRPSVDRWAKAEGLSLIDWTAAVSS